MIESSDKDDLEEDNDNILTLNCTVAFWNDCISWSKCKNHCLSMGAQSYRWFHDGCCECVGQTCINYGINKSKYVKFQIGDSVFVISMVF